MASKTRSWTDVQLIISSVSIALTLGFWGLMASGETRAASVSGKAMLPADPEAPSLDGPMLLPGQTLFLGASPPAAPAPVTNQTKPKHRKGGDGGGDAAASTGSS
jgi:hypothetical protein